MSKPRLVIPISLQFSVRYILRTGLLARIREFAHPERLRAGRKQLVKEICTFDDGRSTERVASQLRSFVEQRVSIRDEAIESVA